MTYTQSEIDLSLANHLKKAYPDDTKDFSIEHLLLEIANYRNLNDDPKTKIQRLIWDEFNR